MGLAALDIEPVGMGRDVAEQVVSMGRVSGLMRRRLERPLAEALRLGKPTEPQTSATEVWPARRWARAIPGRRPAELPPHLGGRGPGPTERRMIVNACAVLV